MGLITRLLASSAGPWILLGLLTAGAIGAGVAFHQGQTQQRDKDRAAEAQAVQSALALRETQYKADLAARAESDQEHLDHANAENLSLSKALAAIEALPPKTLVQTKVVDHGCPVPSLSNDFWVRYRELGLLNAAPADNEH